MDLPIITVPRALPTDQALNRSISVHSILTAAQRVCTIIIPIFQMKKERHNQITCLGTRDYICLIYKPMFLTPAQTALPQSFVASRG